MSARYQSDMELGRTVKVKRPAVVFGLCVGALIVLFLVYQYGASSISGTFQRGGESIKISQLLSASIFLTEQAGKKVAEIRKGADSGLETEKKGETKEGVADYSTLGDQLSHQIITQGLKSLWPELHYRSEERDHTSSKDLALGIIPLENPEISYLMEQHQDREEEPVQLTDVAVWIDPLDATMEYTEGGQVPELLRYVMVMVCVTVKGRPVAMVMHQPFVKNQDSDGITYWAWNKHGVSPSVLQDVDTTQKNPSNMRLVVSRSHPGNAISIVRRAFARTSTTVVPVMAAGAGYKSLLVAQKRADLYFHSTRIKKWDVCPGDLLLETLGGKMTTRTDHSIYYSLDSNPQIEEGIIATVDKDMHNRYMRKLGL